MGFLEAVKSVFSNYVNFSGRAVRSEYWYWVLFSLICGIATAILDVGLFPDNDISPLNTLFSLATFLPSLAVGARRLHDIDRSGWWLLIMLTIIGVIVLIVWFCQKSDPGPNRFGPPQFAGA
jgi:uncharacterized membrane protein YhaH (DUF805 family)